MEKEFRTVAVAPSDVIRVDVCSGVAGSGGSASAADYEMAWNWGAAAGAVIRMYECAPSKSEEAPPAALLTRAMHRMEQIKPQPGSTMASRVAMATWQQCWEAVFGEDKPAQACEGLGRVAK